MNETELHNYLLKRCVELSIRELEGIQLDKVLYVELLNVMKGRSRTLFRSLIKMLVKTIGFTPDVDFRIQGNSLLCLTTIYGRNDHDKYWERTKELFKDKDDIFLNTRRYKICPSMILKNIYTYIELYKKTDFINTKYGRHYLACCLLKCLLYIEKLRTLESTPKVVMSFFDSGMLENLTIQYLRQKGAICVTNQHGQPVFRGHDIDHLNQSQILNLTADYFVAKGEFTRIQFVKAGFECDRIRALGGFGMGDLKRQQTMQKVVGIFLDCPSYHFAAQSNKRLIEIGERICKEKDYKYFIKIHPSDTKEQYYCLTKQDYCTGIVNREASLEELIASMEFGLLHASSIYVDIILNGRKAYKLESEEIFPLVESEDDKFKTSEDLLQKYVRWERMGDSEKKRYLSELKKRYVWEEGFEDRYRNFIYELTAGR